MVGLGTLGGGRGFRCLARIRSGRDGRGKGGGASDVPRYRDVADYLAVPEIVCCGGTWIVPKDALAADDWTAIEKLAADAAALVRRLRG